MKNQIYEGMVIKSYECVFERYKKIDNLLLTIIIQI